MSMRWGERTRIRRSATRCHTCRSGGSSRDESPPPPAEVALVPIISIVGRSGAGKTTVLERLVAELTRRGLRVGVLKHTDRGFEMDREGKDTWRYRRAGARAAGIMSSEQMAVIRSLGGELPVDQAAAALGSDLDIVLTEGFRHAPTTKIEVIRAAIGCEIETAPERLLAVVADCPVQTAARVLSFDDTAALADLIQAEIRDRP